MPLYLKVVKKFILRKVEAGRDDMSCSGGCWESSKYIGLLLYAVRMGDLTEEKIGSWEIPLEEPARFWTPDDMPGCGGKAGMHRYAEPKHFLEVIRFRAPPAGTGAITFRCLLKQVTSSSSFTTSPPPLTPSLPPQAGRHEWRRILLSNLQIGYTQLAPAIGR